MWRLLILFLLFNVLSAKEEILPSIIIGGGVGGGTAALYLARAGFQPLVLEGANPGGALTQSEAVENWPGIARIQGGQLMEQIRYQAEMNGALFLPEEVINVDFKQHPFKIVSRLVADPDQIKIRHVESCIIATGATPNFLSIPGEQDYWGHGVSSCAICDGSLYKGKKVGVVGGGDSAVLEALYLSNLAEEVTLFVRKDRFKATDEKRKNALLSRPNVKILYQTTVEEIKGQDQTLTSVLIKSVDQLREIPLDGLFLAIGSKPNTALFKGKLDLDSKGFIILKKGQQTSVSKVYALGDASDPIDQQAISAAGDAAKAALAVQRELTSSSYSDLIKPAGLRSSSPSAEILQVTSRSQLDSELRSTSLPVFVDFYATWCGPCRRISPKIEAAAALLAGKVKFLKVDVDQAQDLVQKYQIKAMPTVLLFKNGSVIERKVGEPQISELLNSLNSSLRKT